MAPGRLKHLQPATKSLPTSSSSPSSDGSAFSSDLESDSDDQLPSVLPRAGGKKTISTKSRPTKRLPAPVDSNSDSELSEVDMESSDDADVLEEEEEDEEEDLGVVIPRGGKGKGYGLGKGGGSSGAKTRPASSGKSRPPSATKCKPSPRATKSVPASISGKARGTGGKISSKSAGKNTKRKTSQPSSHTNDPSPEPDQLYCICRTGHDGEEFMVACDGCEEWFHGRCVGVTPAIALEREYFCDKCKGGKSEGDNDSDSDSDSDFGLASTPLSAMRKTTASAQKRVGVKSAKSKFLINSSKVGWDISLLTTFSVSSASRKSIPPAAAPIVVNDADSDMLEDDICPVCDGECTCNISVSVPSPAPSIPAPEPEPIIVTPAPVEPKASKKKRGKAKAEPKKKAPKSKEKEKPKPNPEEPTPPPPKAATKRGKPKAAKSTDTWQVEDKTDAQSMISSTFAPYETSEPESTTPTRELYAFILDTSSSDDDIFASEDEMSEFASGLSYVGVGLGSAEENESTIDDSLIGVEGFADYEGDEEEGSEEESDGFYEMEIEIEPPGGGGWWSSSDEDEEDEDIDEDEFFRSSPVVKGEDGVVGADKDGSESVVSGSGTEGGAGLPELSEDKLEEKDEDEEKGEEESSDLIEAKVESEKEGDDEVVEAEDELEELDEEEADVDPMLVDDDAIDAVTAESGGELDAEVQSPDDTSDVELSQTEVKTPEEDPDVFMSWADGMGDESLTVPITDGMDLDALEESMMDILLPPADLTPLANAEVLPPDSPFSLTPGQPTLAGPTSIAFDIKKTQVGPNGEITTTTKSITFQVAPNQREMVAQGGRVGTKRRGGGTKTRGRGGLFNVGPGRPLGTFNSIAGINSAVSTSTATTASASAILTGPTGVAQPLIGTVTTATTTATPTGMTSDLLKRPLDLPAIAAMGGAATPSSVLAMSADARKKEVEKLVEAAKAKGLAAAAATTFATTAAGPSAALVKPAEGAVKTEVKPDLSVTIASASTSGTHAVAVGSSSKSILITTTASATSTPGVTPIITTAPTAKNTTAAPALTLAPAPIQPYLHQPHMQPQYLGYEFPKTIEEFTAMLNAHAAAANLSAAMSAANGGAAVNVGVVNSNGVPVPMPMGLNLAQLGLLGLVPPNGKPGSVGFMLPNFAFHPHQQYMPYHPALTQAPAGSIPVPVAISTTAPPATPAAVPVAVAPAPVITSTPVNTPATITPAVLPASLPSPPESTASPLILAVPPATPAQPAPLTPTTAAPASASSSITFDDLIHTTDLAEPTDTPHLNLTEDTTSTHGSLHRWAKVPISQFRRSRRPSATGRWDIRGAVRKGGKRNMGETLLGGGPSAIHSPVLGPRRRTSVSFGRSVWNVSTHSGDGHSGLTINTGFKEENAVQSPQLFPGFELGMISPELSPLEEGGDMEELDLDGGDGESRKRRKIK
ncbi:hypothetical protein HK097_007141 [Rhizophlyctis rosea]|uniref:PHD-type domain-containing protein n=1 Tax=Rhizophlyctis rosea TaxID=64517 RepID=A0AAD5X5E3_9FUNG|nr:hypothetical protein HK097_007141 [Rhizophlyctis rosea]